MLSQKFFYDFSEVVGVDRPYGRVAAYIGQVGFWS
jgi:hypothetical protein